MLHFASNLVVNWCWIATSFQMKYQKHLFDKYISSRRKLNLRKTLKVQNRLMWKEFSMAFLSTGGQWISLILIIILNWKLISFLSLYMFYSFRHDYTFLKSYKWRKFLTIKWSCSIQNYIKQYFYWNVDLKSISVSNCFVNSTKLNLNA